MMNFQLLGFVLLAAAVSQIDAVCMHPPPAANYSNRGYSGLWHEIGKIQTPGGASYQEDCICTTSTFYSDFPITGDGAMTYDCTLLTPDGNHTILVGQLTAGEVPGNFAQKFNPLLPSADYNVIWLDEDTAMEYDCTRNILTQSEEYCVHFMSRDTTIPQAKLNVMMAYAESLGLNPNQITYQAVEQAACFAQV